MDCPRVWRRSDAHAHSAYFCGKCGRRLKTPFAVYRHLETRHPADRRMA